MARLINSDETVQIALPDLAMDDPVRSSEIHETCLLVARGINFVCDDLATKPIAVIITVMGVMLA